MVRVVVYCTDKEAIRPLPELLNPLLEERREEPLYREFVGDLPGFLRYVRGNPYLIMLIAQSGPEGKTTVRLAKSANPKARLVWFGAQDEALYGYQSHVTHFALLPMDRNKLSAVLDACFLVRDGPQARHVSTVSV